MDQNSNKNIVKISALKFFVASWGLPGDFVSNIMDKEAYKKPTKSCKNFLGRKAWQYFRCYFGPNNAMTPKRHFGINWPLDKNRSFQQWKPFCIDPKNLFKSISPYLFMVVKFEPVVYPPWYRRGRIWSVSDASPAFVVTRKHQIIPFRFGTADGQRMDFHR